MKLAAAAARRSLWSNIVPLPVGLPVAVSAHEVNCSAIRAPSPSCSPPKCGSASPYYGMRALLVLYMVKYLLVRTGRQRDRPCRIRHGLEFLFGPLETQPLSSYIYGLYTVLVYFTPIFGGLLADRVLGQRRTVVIGASLMALGHFMMAFEPLFLFALLALILGNGAFKPNMSSQVGRLYVTGDHRRDRAYSIFYVGINLGAFLAPLVCGTLGEHSAGITALPPPASAC